MGKYIKVFNNHSGYTAFTQTEEFVKPNVSHCITENEMHYSAIVPETRLIVNYNVADASNETRLYHYDAWISEIGIDMFDKVEIDGTEVSVSSLDAAEGMYQLNVGEHTIAYTLKNPTSIGTIFDDSTGTYYIGANFMECATITSVQIPNSVTTIGGTFNGCSSLTSITIPNSVTSIGDYAFQSCTSLTSITLPNSGNTIGKGAFDNCTSLTNITIPNGVTSIGDFAFDNCTSLTSITIPNSVASIGDFAFRRCSGLTSVTIPNGVTSIGEGTFNGCSSLTSITIPNSVTSIGNYAFCECPLDAASKAAVEAINPYATSCSQPD